MAPASEPSVFMVAIRQPQNEKTVEDFSEYPFLQTIWQLKSFLSLDPKRPGLNSQFLLIKVPASKEATWRKNGFYKIDQMFVTISVNRTGYCFSMPSSNAKKAQTIAQAPETALWMLRHLYSNPFQALKDWNSSMDGMFDTLTRAPRQDNGWQFKIECSLGVKIPALEDQLSADIAKANGNPDFKVGFKESGLPLPVFQVAVTSAWVNNDNQGPAVFESPINMGDMGEKGASVKAGRGFDCWARSFRWVSGESDPYYGVFEVIRKGKVHSRTDYSRDGFANMAKQYIKLCD
jgi:hypothetical protein